MVEKKDRALENLSALVPSKVHCRTQFRWLVVIRMLLVSTFLIPPLLCVLGAAVPSSWRTPRTHFCCVGPNFCGPMPATTRKEGSRRPCGSKCGWAGAGQRVVLSNLDAYIVFRALGECVIGRNFIPGMGPLLPLVPMVSWNVFSKYQICPEKTE